MPRDQAAEARAREQEAHADPAERAQLLVEAAGAWAMAGEPEEAERCFRAAIADGGPVVGDARAYYAGFLAGTGRSERAEELYAELWAGKPDDPAVYHVVGENLEHAGDLAEALRWLTAGISRLWGNEVLAEKNLEQDLELQALVAARARVRETAGLPRDQWDELAELRRVAASRADVGDVPTDLRPAMSVAYWPKLEFEAALERWPGAFPEVVRRVGTHLAHRHVVEQTLRLKPPERGGVVVPLSVAGYEEYTKSFRADPDDVATTHQFAFFFGQNDRAIPWPPGRNEPCWCGSGQKYKKCCGTPSFGE